MFRVALGKWPYSRHRGPKTEWANLRKKTPLGTIPEICEAMDLFSQVVYKRATEPQFVPRFATWANQKRWGEVGEYRVELF
jgi:hypothetical protein